MLQLNFVTVVLIQMLTLIRLIGSEILVNFVLGVDDQLGKYQTL